MLQFRKITKEDIPALYDLIMKIARHHSQEQYVNTTEKELMQYGFGENPKYGALVAETDGKLVGYLSYTWNYSIWQGTEYMNLDDLYAIDGFSTRGLCKERNPCNEMGGGRGKFQSH